MSLQRRGGRQLARVREVVYSEESHCWLCGSWVDPALPRNHERARSLDHVRPLSHGGAEFDRGNLRLAHRVCNSRRGDRVERKRHVRTW